MRRYRLYSLVCAICASLMLALALPSCGTLRTHWDVDHVYDFDDGGHYKPKKHKHHKKYKHHKKHHHHHDDDDDDDDDD